jgi:hypothetical protein
MLLGTEFFERLLISALLCSTVSRSSLVSQVQEGRPHSDLPRLTTRTVFRLSIPYHRLILRGVAVLASGLAAVVLVLGGVAWYDRRRRLR